MNKLNINEKEKFINELLVKACKRQNLEVSKFLVEEEGADPNYVDDEGYSPLWEASSHSDEELVKFLLDCGADPNACTSDVKPLHIAADSPFKSLEVIEMLINHGADVQKKDGDGYTALDRACLSDSEEKIQICEFLETVMDK